MPQSPGGAVPDASEGTPNGRPGGPSNRALTTWSLIALVLGVSSGLLAGQGLASGEGMLIPAADAVVRVWTNAFQLLVAPLIVSHLYLALTNGWAGKKEAGRLGLMAPVVFMGLLVGIATISLVVTMGLLRIPVFQSLSLPVPPAPADGVQASAAGASAHWVDSFLPPNLIAAASTSNLLPLILFTIAFALGARHLGHERQLALRTLFGAVSEVMFTLVDWVLRVTPFVIFALCFRVAFDSGLSVGGVLLGFTVLEIICLLVSVAALYPAAAVLGRIPLRRFATAMGPAQLVAMATRSSLATLPALLRSAETSLRLPRTVSGAILPLAGATLKLSPAVSGPVKLLFLASVLGLRLEASQVVTFIITILLLSPTTVGVPRVASGSRSLPAYVAAGIPGEYVVLLGATTFLVDVFMTLLNTTGYMTANVLLGRWAGVKRGADEGPSMVPAGATTPPLGASAILRQP